MVAAVLPYENTTEYSTEVNALSFVNMEYALLSVATTPDPKLKNLSVAKFTVLDAALYDG